MPATAYYEHRALDGKVTRIPYEISDEELKRTHAPERLQQAPGLLAQWAAEARAIGQGNTPPTPQQQRDLFARFADLCERLEDILIVQGLDQL